MRRLELVPGNWFPAYVVWELTLRCDHACHHCGSRAGVARNDELSETEALGVVQELASLGAREVVLIGGEAYLHEAFFQVIRALKAAGISPQLTTGGRGVGVELATHMAEAGLDAASVSIDGLEANHDRMRNAPGSYQAAIRALRALRDAGVHIGSNINLNRLNQGDLEELYEILRAIGISAWQVQLTAPLGRAADRTDLVLQPWQLLDLLPRIARLKERAFSDGIRLMPGNNLGYFGPEEALLRSFDQGGRDHYAGCQAGKHVMGIESQGNVKGCPSLQSAHYVGGNLRARSLKSAWDESRVLMERKLWGFCASCAFADTCQGGCTFTAHALMGRPGNNPYCHFRARELQKKGLRERLVPARAATGQPFDNGAFDLIEEAFGAPEPPRPAGEALVRITQKPAITAP